MSRKNKNAFTLSEVLLTLAIMGTLMALTIPSLINSTSQNSYINGLKKTYSMLDMATNQIMIKNSGTLANAFSSSSNARDKYIDILEWNKSYEAGSIIDNCWSNSTSKLSGGAAITTSTLEAGAGFNPNTNYQGAILADGTDLLFYIQDKTCNTNGISLNLPYSTDTHILCGYIVADINGFKKNPNQFGKDIFMFLLGSNGLLPGGDPHTLYNATGNCNTADTTHNGYGCASQVLNTQDINYGT